uniref:Uncharacterized protein n=1 Tax=Aegilops tauschii subsp. strangulata TaxID=200361 RepID=A0A453N824_AEGTS
MMRAVTAHGHAGDVCRFQEFVEESYVVVGAPSVGDFFPALRWVDRLRGIDAAYARLQTKRDAFVAGLVDDHRRRRGNAGGDGDTTSVIDELLALQETDPEYYTDNVVKGIVLVMFTTGTDHDGADRRVDDGAAAEAPGDAAEGEGRDRRQRRRGAAGRGVGHGQPALPALRREGEPPAVPRRPAHPGARGHGGLHGGRLQGPARHDDPREHVGDQPGRRRLGLPRGVPAGAVLGRRHGQGRAHAAVRARPEAVPGGRAGHAPSWLHAGGARAVLRVGCRGRPCH